MINTEELPLMQVTQQSMILTKKCNGGWIACLASDPGKWEWGTTEAEAIGKLHLLHQDVLGSIQREEEAS